MLAHPAFRAYFDAKFGELELSLTLALIPQLRSLLNQLLLLCESTYALDRAAGFQLPPSPLAPMLMAWPASSDRLDSLIKEHPGLGSSLSEFYNNCRKLRSSRNDEQHLKAVEDMVQRLRPISERIQLPVLHGSDPFLHALLVSSDDLVTVFLAAPRLIQLAQATLQFSMDSLDPQPAHSWSWRIPNKREDVQRFIDKVLAAVPGLADSSDAFRTAADALWGTPIVPLGLSYPPKELRCRVAQCLSLGIFTPVIQKHYRFAFTVVTHLDIFLQDKV